MSPNTNLISLPRSPHQAPRQPQFTTPPSQNVFSKTGQSTTTYFNQRTASASAAGQNYSSAPVTNTTIVNQKIIATGHAAMSLKQYGYPLIPMSQNMFIRSPA